MLVLRRLGLVLSFFALALPAAADHTSGFGLAVDPDPLPPGAVGRIVVTGIASCPQVSLPDYSPSGVITVYFSDDCSTIPPQPQPFVRRVRFGPLTLGTYILRLRAVFDDALLAEQTIQVGPPRPPLELELSPSPLAPGAIGEAILTGRAACPGFEETTVDGETITLLFQSHCPILPPGELDFRISTEIGPLPEGDYTVEVRDANSRELLLERPLAVAEGRLGLELVPAQATTLDSVVAVASVFGACVSIGEIEIGSERIEIVAERGCPFTPPPPPFEHVVPITLGRLEPGDYTVTLTDAPSGEELSRDLWVVEASPPLVFEPEAPGEDDAITVLATIGEVAICDPAPQVSIGGGRVDIVLDGSCLLSPPPAFPPQTTTLPIEIGSLPAGTYTVRVLSSLGGLFSRGRLKVQSAGACIVSQTTLCLAAGRFRVRALYHAGDAFGPARAVPGTPDSGSFTFFDPDNVELVVKVLDGCGTGFQSYWVFASGLTNVAVELEVTDTRTGVSKTYVTQRGQPFPTILDTRAFETCP